MPEIRWHAIGWRLRAARRWIACDIARRVIECVARIPMLRRTPRGLVRPFERVLIEAAVPPAFDTAFYAARYLDGGGDALRHYLTLGWQGGAEPGAGFDDAHYRRISGLRPTTSVSPLAHYLVIGRRRGLTPMPADAPDGAGPRRAAPTPAVLARDGLADAFHTVPARRIRDADCVVVMPVYAGRTETLTAIRHVLAARCLLRIGLLVVDDCGPEPALRADLDRLAGRGLFDLARQPRNLGFAAAINRGTAVAGRRDVVWLNADTEVYDGWIDRLHCAAYAADRVATVTPLTNNGTICAYPRMDVDNAMPGGLAGAALDGMAARVNAGCAIPAPTAVGFATYVRRDALDAIGPLDAQTFGQGYGEENDFSQRAIKAGWVNLIASDVFVRHHGATSFGAARNRRIEQALGIIEARHPGYHRSVQRFLDEDPLSPARARLDRARLLARRGPRNVLLITHARGGGTEQHVEEETARLSDAGVSVYVMRPGADGAGTVSIAHSDAGDVPSLAALDRDAAETWAFVRMLKLEHVQIHHLIDFGADAPRRIGEALIRLGVPYTVMLHDYFSMCPRVNMADAAGRYCGAPGTGGCQRCLFRRGSAVGRPNIRHWRAAQADLLARATEVLAPDPDVAHRLAPVFPDLRIRIAPHERLSLPPPIRPRGGQGPLRVGTLGAIGAIKGFDVLLDLAAHGRRHPGRFTLTVIGHTRSDESARAAGIHVTGPYRNEEVPHLIGEAGLDVILLPSIWPETWSYTLSLALMSGLPIVAFDIGAIASRLRAAGRGTLLPLGEVRNPVAVLDALERAARAPVSVPLQETGSG